MSAFTHSQKATFMTLAVGHLFISISCLVEPEFEIVQVWTCGRISSTKCTGSHATTKGWQGSMLLKRSWIKKIFSNLSLNKEHCYQPKKDAHYTGIFFSIKIPRKSSQRSFKKKLCASFENLKVHEKRSKWIFSRNSRINYARQPGKVAKSYKYCKIKLKRYECCKFKEKLEVDIEHFLHPHFLFKITVTYEKTNYNHSFLQLSYEVKSKLIKVHS